MWEGFMTGLGSLGSSLKSGLGNMFGASAPDMSSLANINNLGSLTTSGLETVNPNMFTGMLDSAGSLASGVGNFLTSKGGQGLMKTGFEGFNALQSANLGKKQMGLANRQMGMSEDAYARDRESAEARKNLRF